MTKGKVYLIGAGPGDPGLLGLKAKHCLEIADAVVYDRLADPRIVAYSNKNAEMIYVGKASCHHALPQWQINQLLVKLASEGKIVARLKGGDPFVFGRGGEEAMELKKAGLPFEFVPGVTSAIAVAEYAGIPVTHRAVATSFAVVTGHEDPTKPESQINWKGLATSVNTLVFLMGVENIEKISSQLIANGRSAATPAAVIRWGTHPEQRTLITTLGEAAADVARTGMKPPAIFLVGEVVKLRSELQWYDNKPLFGKTVVVTRARTQASALTAKLEAEGAKVIEVPAIKIVPPADIAPLDKAIAEIDTYKWLVLTSANGVDSFFEHLKAAGKDTRALGRLKVAAIGSATAKQLEGYGVIADLVPSEYKAENLAEELAGQIAAGEKILVARAKVAREVLIERLRALGAVVDVVTAYETVADCQNKEELLEALAAAEDVVVTFTSSSTVTNLLEVLGQDKSLLEKAALASIGPITSATLVKNGLTPAIEAKEYTIDGLTEAILSFYNK